MHGAKFEICSAELFSTQHRKGASLSILNNIFVNFSVNVRIFVNLIRFGVAPCHNGHFDAHIGGVGSTVSEITSANRFLAT